jgi:hypothetical protein
MDEGVVFHQATVYQERNEHDLLKDFEQEVPGYLLNDKIRVLLDAIRLGGGDDVAGNLVRCYEALVAGGVLPAGEMPIVRAWCNEVSRLDR